MRDNGNSGSIQNPILLPDVYEIIVSQPRHHTPILDK